jgi:anaphase-promoting complex subunit 2
MPLYSFFPKRRNIEILKLRFGDASLQACEVMLKDMTDSRRLYQHMQAEEPVRALDFEFSTNVHDNIPDGIVSHCDLEALLARFTR